MDLAEEIGRKGCELLRCFSQPVQDRVGRDLKDARGGPDAEPLGQAGQHVDDQVHGHWLAMKNRAMMLEKIALARGALELAPWATIGMPISPQVAPPEPAAITTASMGAEVLRGLHGARPAVG